MMLENRIEFKKKLDRIRKNFYLCLYLVLILVALNDFFLALVLLVPLCLVMASSYTAVDNYYEKKYFEKVMERRSAN